MVQAAIRYPPSKQVRAPHIDFVISSRDESEIACAMGGGGYGVSFVPVFLTRWLGGCPNRGVASRYDVNEKNKKKVLVFQTDQRATDYSLDESALFCREIFRTQRLYANIKMRHGCWYILGSYCILSLVNCVETFFSKRPGSPHVPPTKLELRSHRQCLSTYVSPLMS